VVVNLTSPIPLKERHSARTHTHTHTPQALSAALWSLLKAKKSMLKVRKRRPCYWLTIHLICGCSKDGLPSSLQNKEGFMAHFYLLSETISPTLVWGFLGTDTTLRARCLQFRVSYSQMTLGKLVCSHLARTHK